MAPETLLPSMLQYGLLVLLAIASWNVKEVVKAVKELKESHVEMDKKVTINDYRLTLVEKTLKGEAV